MLAGMTGIWRRGIGIVALASMTLATAGLAQAEPEPLENGEWPQAQPQGEPLENGTWPPPGSEPVEEAPEVEVVEYCPYERAPREGHPLTCYVVASDTTRLLDPDAIRLCEFAPSNAPVECYKRGEDETNLLSSQLVDLCRCAFDTRPVDCVREAQRETFLNDAQVIDLCAATQLEGLGYDCRPIYGPPRDPYYGSWR
jgi:hypothetical protein